mmetsp:Transcript_20260/g.30059  ORF Transcript_20260/g.30059 Transcript_20260/m.30059 type:complete len:668 (-) Transcript_20260:188-2191(-)|eukprot:CAMPEP_0194205116 /NCGR_PEP_ID=MMETSP0156-20130528/4459_1 /TAXON_ID=33649 /ORGANISM="Thalassionema nitzschioides, Strain L26-B" /LENGTH=667 /DNA_ID=CAMNT_0038931301 /DNA_START=928 /DNA_END=2931 /DNA_ORIENTATION=-
MSKRVMDSREEESGGHRTNITGGSDYQSGSKGGGQIGQQQHYQLNQHQEQSDRRRLPDADESSLPPHVSAGTAATTPSSTETVSSRSISEGDKHRQNPAQLKTISSSSELHSIPPDHSASWNQPPSPLAAAKIPDSEPSFEQITSSPRYSDASSPAAIKLLVSNNVAGSIIGRSGQTISDLQTQSATRIKLSQAGDYYPGTQDRVCLVQGHSEHVKRAVNMLLTRLYALQQQQHYHHFTWQRQQQERGLMHPETYPETLIGVASEGSRPSIIPGFSFVVRILVPVPCCGMIIGKGGTNIKQMVDNSGVSSVRLSPKEGGDSPSLPGQSQVAVAALVSATAERVVTITGPDLNSCLTCMHIILDGMTSHPDISRYTNMTTSYTRAVSAATTPFPGSQPTTGSIRRSDQHMEGFSPSQQNQDDFSTKERSSSHGHLDRHPGISQTSMGLGSPSLVQTMEPMHNFVPPFGTAPFLQDTAARQVQPSSLYLMPTTAAYAPAPQSNDHMGLHVSHSAPDLLALQMQNTLRLSDAVEGTSTSFSGPSSFVHQIPQPTHLPPGFVVQVAVADNLIGSILGRGGRTLNELQVLSNTRIRISQRGEYIPGTKNRVVTIRGPTAQSVSNAQFLMSQRMVLPPTASTYIERPDYGVMPYDATLDTGYSHSDVQHQPPS